jgi:glycosyltransferase involved in cell wall biosynthesis
MRIAVCSPLHTDSAIGRVAIKTAEELSLRGHVIDLVSTERERPSEFQGASQAPVFWMDPNAQSLLMSADMVVVHIGDNYEFHAGGVYILKHWRCVGIFHDANIYGLFRNWAFDRRTEAEGLARYHELISKIYKRSHTLPDTRHAIPLNLDMLPWLAVQCAVAVTHSTFYAEQLRAACPGQVFTTPLTYSASSDIRAATIKKPDTPLRVLTVGHVNANKCCDSVIEAIAASDIRRVVEYRIAGPVCDGERDRLTSLAAIRNVRLTVLGRVSNDMLAEELRDADVISCLRRPILEGASASAIEAMLSAKPIIVVDSGFYADIDDDSAVKVSIDFTTADLNQALDRLAASSELRLQYGKRGQAWAEKHCNVKVYVDVLENALRAAIGIGPFLELAHTFTQQLQALGIDESSSPWRDVANCLQTLVAGPQPIGLRN